MKEILKHFQDKKPLDLIGQFVIESKLVYACIIALPVGVEFEPDFVDKLLSELASGVVPLNGDEPLVEIFVFILEVL